jgi:ribosomal protein L24E
MGITDRIAESFKKSGRKDKDVYVLCSEKDYTNISKAVSNGSMGIVNFEEDGVTYHLFSSKYTKETKILIELW